MFAVSSDMFWLLKNLNSRVIWLVFVIAVKAGNREVV